MLCNLHNIVHFLFVGGKIYAYHHRHGQGPYHPANSIWTTPNEVWEPLSPPVALETALSDNELAKQYRVKYGADCKCVFKKEKDLWRCACGAINHASEKNCHSCQREAASLAALNVDELKADRDHRVAAEQKATAEKKAADRKSVV